VELEFIHAKIYANTEQNVSIEGQKEGEFISTTIRLKEIIQHFSLSHGMNMVLFNLVFYRPVNEDIAGAGSRLSLFGRLGVGPSILHTESMVFGIYQEQYELNRPAFQIACGGTVKLNRNFSLFIEYKATFVRIKEAKIARGNADLDVFTNHFIAGINMEFK